MDIENILSLNKEITKEQWIKWNTSVWSIDLTMENCFKRYRGNHPCPSTPEIYYRLMLLYSKPHDTILDMFSGTGTGGVVAKKIERNFIGVEINKEYIKLAEHNLSVIEGLHNTKQVFINSDIRTCNLRENSVDLVITSPPYYNNIRYSNHDNDISQFNGLDDYLFKIKRAFGKVKSFLKPGRYIAIIIGDSQKGKQFIPIHRYFIELMSDFGFTLTHLWINHFPEGTKKKNQKREIGYPNYMYVEFDHEYILVFCN